MSVDESIREREAAETALNDELHDLHSTLSGAVTEFEALLDETLDALPDWVDADRDAIRDLFHIEVDDQRVTMGPRAAAMVASRVEIFVRSCTAKRADPYDDEQAAKWVARVETTEALITSMIESGREAGEFAREHLALALDELITALAEQERDEPEPDPEDKLDALREKLRSGKMGAALATRENEADTLEVQRRKTEELQEAWAPLTELVGAGADMGEDAGSRLRAIVASAVAVAIDHHEELAVAMGVEVEVDSPPPVPKPPTPPKKVEPLTRADGSDALEEPRFRYDTDAPRTAQDTPARKPHTATATMEVSLSIEEFREPAFRIVNAWRRVELGEAFLALGPPTIYIGGVTALALAYQVGFWPDNPFSEWPAALPMFFAFALWAIGAPLLGGWQVEWDGRVPRPMKMSTKREQGFVDVDEMYLQIGGHQFDFTECGANLTRFEADGARGWSLIVQDSVEEVLFASEATSGRWDDSNSDLALNEPQGAWRISEDALLQIADRC